MRRFAIGACVVVVTAISAVVAFQSADAGSVHVYRCLGDDGADAGIGTFVHNPGSTAATVRWTTRDATGGVTDTGTQSILPKGTFNHVFNGSVIEYRTRSNLLIDGVAFYFNGAAVDTEREVRCK